MGARASRSTASGGVTAGTVPLVAEELNSVMADIDLVREERSHDAFWHVAVYSCVGRWMWLSGSSRADYSALEPCAEWMDMTGNGRGQTAGEILLCKWPYQLHLGSPCILTCIRCTKYILCIEHFEVWPPLRISMTVPLWTWWRASWISPRDWPVERAPIRLTTATMAAPPPSLLRHVSRIASRRTSAVSRSPSLLIPCHSSLRRFQTEATPPRVPEFAFAFE